MPTKTEVTESLAAAGPNGFAPDEAPAPNVVEALRRVMRDLPAIGKDQRASQQQGGYAYRGIEDITRALQPLLARHGVVFVPEVVSMDTRELIVNGKPWTDTILRVRYHIHGPGDTCTEAVVVGVGRDNSDKGANKAMTQALKYALLQTFCISDAKDDADSGSPEADTGSVYDQARKADARGQVLGPDEQPTSKGNVRRGPRVLEGWADYAEQKAGHEAYEAAFKELTEEQRATVKSWKEDQGFGWPMPRAQVDACLAEVERAAAEPF